MSAHVWTLSWFDPDSERLVGEEDFISLSDLDVAQILAIPADREVLLNCGFPIDEVTAASFNAVTGYVFQLARFHYFLGATATP
jgi:hypothetical protein